MDFRVMSYNIHKCVGGLDRRHDPARVAEAIAACAPDILLLQEAQSRDEEAGCRSQVDILAERLNYRHRAYFPNVPRRRGRYGNAILSRWPILETQHIDLTIPPKKRRSVVHARLRLRSPSGRGRTLHVYNLHLGLSGVERGLQLRRFLASHPFAGLHARAPVVLGGDFNDLWGTLGRRFLAPAGFRGPARAPFTVPAFAPLRALDSLYVRGDVRMLHLRRERRAAARRASDHLPIVAELSLA